MFVFLFDSVFVVCCFYLSVYFVVVVVIKDLFCSEIALQDSPTQETPESTQLEASFRPNQSTTWCDLQATYQQAQ